MNKANDLSNLLVLMCKELVDDRESLDYTISHTEETFTFHIDGPRCELAKLIGRDGLTLTAFRRIAISVGRRLGFKHLDIQIGQPAEPTHDTEGFRR